MTAAMTSTPSVGPIRESGEPLKDRVLRVPRWLIWSAMVLPPIGALLILMAYHVAAGLATPDPIVTSDPIAAKAFLAHHERLVYKSISGLRSIVNTVEANEPDRLDRVGHGPVQLQQWIDGLDVRVHVVGDRCFATSVSSNASDYR